MGFVRKGFLIMSALALTNSAVAKERIGDFALLDDQGKFHQLSYYGDYQAVAVLVSGLSSQADKEQLSAFADVAKTRSDDVVFWVLNPNPEMDRDAVRAALDSQQIDLPVLMDESQLVSKSLLARKFGEVFLLNPQTATLIQRTSAGGLKASLNALNGGLKQVSSQNASDAVTGEPIQYTSVGAVSYNADIVPILERN